MRVLIVDNNAAFRYTLTCHLRSQPDFEVVAAIALDDEATRQAALLNPDVIVIDSEMPETDAATSIRALKHAAPAAGMVMLSIVPSARYQEECRHAGIDAYLLKDSPADVIFAAIRQLRQDGRSQPSPVGGGE